MKRILRIYDFFAAHRKVMACTLAALSALFICLLLTLRFSEDIGDFLPADESDREYLSVYRKISGADDIYMLFSNPDDVDRTISAIELFARILYDGDTEGWCSGLTFNFDSDRLGEITDFVYDNVPYFLTADDYDRMDSLLAVPGYIQSRLAADREMLMFPSGGMVTDNIVRDPLGLFGPVLSSLRESFREMNFNMYDGYIFTPDDSRAIAMMSSPFGNSETAGNTRLLRMIDDAVSQMQQEYPDVRVSVVGGPAIAVGNSSCIKRDSVIAISLSVILVAIILILSLNSFRNILLIFLSIGWGVLAALGGMALFRDSVSIIVIGISSVIIGIAVNYPLHLIAHTAHQPDRRKAIGEIATPLMIGNITTVGAFMALVPLKSVALSDLGLFAAILLVGTILFVLLFLPHFISIRQGRGRESRFSQRFSGLPSLESRPVIIAVIILTLLLFPFSLRTGFNPNLSDINYMTDAERADLDYFQQFLDSDTAGASNDVYVLSYGADLEQAIERNAAVSATADSLLKSGAVLSVQGVSRFLTTRNEQERRLAAWNAFVAEHREQLVNVLPLAAAEQGFSANAFSRFADLTGSAGTLSPRDASYFAPLTELVLSRHVAALDDGRICITDILNVAPEMTASTEELFSDSFDIAGMSGSLTDALSDNFNYIGWVCSIIVFLFLWLSFGRIEMAVISFLPMAVSWVWILGLMSIAGIRFNIVNIILATFIFGQGDDYTIFMTEGCQYEYTYRRPMLASYKSSILKSALIMFAGIGTLIIARHPAMRSLAQVTMIGMFSVVLMSYIIPPVLFRWITCRRDGSLRRYPLTFSMLFRGNPSTPAAQVRSRYIYKGREIVRTVSRNLKERGAEIAAGACSEGVFRDDGYGEQALLLALTHPDLQVRAVVQDEERLAVAVASAEGLVSNIEFTIGSEESEPEIVL